MYEILLYTGIIVGCCLLIITVYIFFKQKIPSVIRYLIKSNNIKFVKPTVNMKKGKTSDLKNNKTEILEINDDKTQILEIAQNYATALLDADSTTILPSLDE